MRDIEKTFWVLELREFLSNLTAVCCTKLSVKLCIVKVFELNCDTLITKKILYVGITSIFKPPYHSQLQKTFREIKQRLELHHILRGKFWILHVFLSHLTVHKMKQS